MHGAVPAMVRPLGLCPNACGSWYRDLLAFDTGREAQISYICIMFSGPSSIRHLLFSLVFLSMAWPAQGKDDDWAFVTQKEGIQVYSRAVEGSKVKALKVVCTVSARPTEVLALLLDAPAAVEWVSHTKSCRLLERVSGTELYYYSEVWLPWPLDNRDFVAHVKAGRDPHTQEITVFAPAVPSPMPKRKGVVRIEHSIGRWSIAPLPDGGSKIDYVLQVDPGGHIPAWLVNALAAEGPIESFVKMRKMLQRPVYKQYARELDQAF